MNKIQNMIKYVGAVCWLITACSEYDANRLNMMRNQCSKSGAYEGHACSSVSCSILENGLLEAAKNGDLQRLNALIADGVDMNACDNRGWTALMYAVYNGNEACVMALLDTGANVEVADYYGRNALMFAACNGNTSCVNALLNANANANMNETDKCMNTSLIYAASEGHESCVKILLEAGADRYIINRNRDTALKLAIRRGHMSCVRALNIADRTSGFGHPVFNRF